MASVVPQHPPAMKVGGRRLSISRPKPQVAAGQKSPSPPGQETEGADYPRPAAPAEQEAHDPEHPHDDHEEVPKKEKKSRGGSDHDRKLLESIHRKAEQNRPKRDTTYGKDARGGKVIDQPAGKGL